MLLCCVPVPGKHDCILEEWLCSLFVFPFGDSQQLPAGADPAQYGDGAGGWWLMALDEFLWKMTRAECNVHLMLCHLRLMVFRHVFVHCNDMWRTQLFNLLYLCFVPTRHYVAGTKVLFQISSWVAYVESILTVSLLCCLLRYLVLAKFKSSESFVVKAIPHSTDTSFVQYWII